MKTILPWLIAAAGIAAAVFLFKTNLDSSAQIATLQQDNQRLQALKTENDTLKAGQVAPDELARLRKDSEDALRLRNEVRQLRDKLGTASKEAQAAQSLAQRAMEQVAESQVKVATAQQDLQARNEAIRLGNAQTGAQERALFESRYGISPANTSKETVNACINNLRQLDGAKQQWALENKQPGSATPTSQQLVAYFPKNVMPACPAGGNYTINSVDTPPACSIPGHTFPH